MADNSKDSGSFISGFGMGLITGAAAYFLFATEQGEQLRKKALKEWEQAQKTIAHEAGIEVPKDLRQLMKETMGYFAESIKAIQELDAEPASTSKSTAKAKKTTRSKPTGKFKGL